MNSFTNLMTVTYGVTGKF